MHVLDLEAGQIAKPQRIADDLARVGGVDVAVDDLVILDDHHAVPVALEEGAQLLTAGPLVLVDEELGAVAILDVLDPHQVVGEDPAAGRAGRGLLALAGVLGLDDDAVLEHAEHTLEDGDKAGAARVDHPGLFEHRQLFGGAREGLLGRGEDDLEHLDRILGGGGGGSLGAHAGDGQHGALSGLHHRFVRGGDPHLKRLGDVGGRGLLLAGKGLREAAEEQRGDDPAVAPRAPQHAGGGGLAGGLDGAVVGQRREIPLRRADGHAHVGAGVPVGHREDVQLIHLTALVGDAVRAADHAVSQNRTFYHLVSTPNLSLCRSICQQTMSSTETLILRTFRPVASSTTYRTLWVMLLTTAAMFSP